MIVRSGKWMAEMARQRLSAEMGVGCVRAIGYLMDRSESHWATRLHKHLTGGADWSGGNAFHRTAFGHEVVKAWGRAIPFNDRHVAANEREKLLSSCTIARSSCQRDESKDR